MGNSRQSISICEVIASISVNAGGTGMFMSDICHYLPDTPGEFSLLTASRPSVADLPMDERVHLEKLEVRKHLLSKSLKPDRKETLAAFARLAASRAVNIIHLHGIWLDICRDTVAWARSNDTSLVISPHGMLEPWALNHKKLKKQLAMALYQRRDLRSAKAFHACSHLEAESIRLAGFKQPIAVIPNGVQLPEIDPASTISHPPSAKRTALFLSRINPKKGLPMLLDVWKKLAPEDWQLVIAGNDDSNHTPVLQRKVIELGLSDSVKIVGPLFGEDKRQAYLNADIFVLPSYSENFGIVVTEALGYQVPVLTTTGCPWGELQTERCGWWVEPTPAGIQTGLTQALATSDADLAEMGVRGRHLVEAKYQWPGIADRMFEFYEWILNGGKQPEFVI